MKCWPPHHFHLPQLPYRCTICHPLNIQLQHSHSLTGITKKIPCCSFSLRAGASGDLASLVQASPRLYSVADLWMLWLPKRDCQLKSDRAWSSQSSQIRSCFHRNIQCKSMKVVSHAPHHHHFQQLNEAS